MSDKQIIERLATEVMGWTLRSAKDLPKDHPGLKLWGEEAKFPDDERGRSLGSAYALHLKRGGWNPLKDWNHTMQVKERLCFELRMEDAFTFALQKRVMPKGSYCTTDWALMVLATSQRDFCLAALDCFEK